MSRRSPALVRSTRCSHVWISCCLSHPEEEDYEGFERCARKNLEKPEAPAMPGIIRKLKPFVRIASGNRSPKAESNPLRVCWMSFTRSLVQIVEHSVTGSLGSRGAPFILTCV